MAASKKRENPTSNLRPQVSANSKRKSSVHQQNSDAVSSHSLRRIVKQTQHYGNLCQGHSTKMSPNKNDSLAILLKLISSTLWRVSHTSILPLFFTQTPQNQMSWHPNTRKWTQVNSPVTISMSHSSKLNNPEQLYEDRKSNPTPYSTRLRTTGRNSYDRRTTLVQKNRQKKPSEMFLHATWCLSSFPNYTMENFWQNDCFEWDMEDLLHEITNDMQKQLWSTYYTSTKEQTEETVWNVSTRHAVPL